MWSRFRDVEILQKAKLDNLPFYADGTMKVFKDLKKKGLAFGMPTTVIIDKDGCSLGVLNGWPNGPATMQRHW